jgi:hypothetical protein
MNILSDTAQKLMKAAQFIDLKNKGNKEGIIKLLDGLNEKEKKAIEELEFLFNRR